MASDSNRDFNDGVARETLQRWSNGYVSAQLVHAAAALGLADLLKDGPKGHEDLAAASGSHAPSLLRALRGMADLGLFEQDEEGRFHLAPLGEPLRLDHPSSLRDSIMLHGGELAWRPWGELLYTLRTGETAFDYALGMPFFAYLERHPETGVSFSRAVRTSGLHGINRLAETVVEVFDLTNVSRIVDVGGGSGALIEALLKAHPQATGVFFDRPKVVAEARNRLSKGPLAGRCEFVEGDFFEAVPEGGNLYLLSRILHDWEDDRCVTILRNCHRAIAGGGRVLVFERVLGVDRPLSPSGVRQDVQSDIDMLVTTGGRERTDEEYRALLATGGFDLTRLVPVPAGSADVLEARPNVEGAP